MLPQTRKKINLHTPGKNKFLVMSFLFLLLILAVYFLTYSYRVSLFDQANNFDKQFNDLERSRDKTLEQSLLTFNQQLSSVRPLLNNHIVWSLALQRLQRLIIPTVQFQSLGGDFNKKSFSFRAIADSYTTVARQISAFYNEPMITDIALNKVSNFVNGRVEFDMQLSIDINKIINKQ